MHIYVYIHISLFLYISHRNIRTAIIMQKTLQMQTYVQLQSELFSYFQYACICMKIMHFIFLLLLLLQPPLLDT